MLRVDAITLFWARCLIVLGLCLGVTQRAESYSVLTHEAIIDAAWKDNIVPLLVNRFGPIGAEDLRRAHAYAYGGAIIQDMGYYPLGNKFFSDLTHYVRSGDFILNLIAEAENLNDYAFALGSLAHYAADNDGHREAVNRSVAITYPKLEQRFGHVVTYADDPVSHLKVEFSFDVAEVAQGHYAPEAYHDFIGFEVAQACLERAFLKTYSIELSSVLHEELAIGTYRYAVSSAMPALTKAAWSMKGKEIQTAQPGITKQRYLFNLSRSSYQKKWGTSYERPGFGARTIAFFFRLIPKIGPLKAFAFHPPNATTEALFMKSVSDSLDHYRTLLAEHRQGILRPTNRNFDTGQPTKPGEYSMADAAYAKLVKKLQGKTIDAKLRADILLYYSDLNAQFSTKRNPKAWASLLKDLDSLRAGIPNAAAASAR